MDHIIGNFWTGSEDDVVPVGDGAKGYIGATINPPGKDFKVTQRSRGWSTAPARATWPKDKIGEASITIAAS